MKEILYTISLIYHNIKIHNEKSLSAQYVSDVIWIWVRVKFAYACGSGNLSIEEKENPWGNILSESLFGSKINNIIKNQLCALFCPLSWLLDCLIPGPQ